MDDSKCPFCGSENIVQTNTIQNKTKATAIGLGAKALFGSNPLQFFGLGEESYDKKFKCNQCGKTWDDWFENEESYVYNNLKSDYENGKYDVYSHVGILKLIWRIDACIYKITSCEGQTGYSFNNGIKDYPSHQYRQNFFKIRICVYLDYLKHIFSKPIDTKDVFEILMTCEAGLYDLNNYNDSTSYKCLKSSFEYLKSCISPTNVISPSEYEYSISYLDEDDFWYNRIKWISDVPNYNIQDCETSDKIVEKYLKDDFRLSLWMLNADQYGSIAHITSHPYTIYSNNEWEKDLHLLRTNFKISHQEQIIFFRDNTFFSTKHNQGLVITEKGLYYIENNSNPILNIIIWEDISSIMQDDDSITFFLKQGNSSKLPIKLITKASEEFNSKIIQQIKKDVFTVFSDIVEQIKIRKE